MNFDNQHMVAVVSDLFHAKFVSLCNTSIRYGVFLIEIERFRSFERHKDLIHSVSFAGESMGEPLDGTNTGLPQNRFDALEEVQNYLGFESIDLNQVLDVLHATSDGYLIFHFGDLVIEFSRGFECSDSSDEIHMSIEFMNTTPPKTTDYEFNVIDLKLLRQKKIVRAKRSKNR